MRRRDCTWARYDSTHDTELEAVRDTARGEKGKRRRSLSMPETIGGSHTREPCRVRGPVQQGTAVSLWSHVSSLGTGEHIEESSAKRCLPEVS